MNQTISTATRVAGWFRDRSLTLVMLALFVLFLVGQIVTGWYEFNETRLQHGASAILLSAYLAVGHPWEALFENWESEFLQMSAFVVLTTFLYQRGSPESRQPGAIELVDTDPRAFADREDVPWPVKRGGWVLAIYEHSLGLTLFLLFVVSWVGHVVGGWADTAATRRCTGSLSAGRSTI